MNVRIDYSKQAIKYLKKNNKLSKEKCTLLLHLALKRIFLNELSSVDIKKLQGKESMYRIRYGDMRIIFSVNEDGQVLVAFVLLILPRGDVYKKI